jgi:chromate reductase
MMKLVVFGGSLRTDSCNKKYAREALRLAQGVGAEGEFIDLKNYPVPVYDGDIESASGLPQAATELAQKIAAADALIISTPEYNGTIPGMLKNLVDWLSRVKPMPFSDKHLLLLAASPGALGGIRSLWHSRQAFEVLGVHVYPNMMGLPGAYDAFDADGKLKDEKTQARLKDLINQFVKHVTR